MVNRKAKLWLTSLLLVVACGGAGFTTYEPVRDKTKLEADQLLTAAMRTIDKLDYRPVGLDRSSHTVSTREKEVGYSSVPRLSYKYAFTIETGGGVLSITASCTQNSATSREEFSDCGDERPRRVVDELDALREAILEAAKSVPKGPVFDEPMAEGEEADDGPDEKKPKEKAGTGDAKSAPDE